MHLKSLTIKGFKSFARPTTFQFEPGVTAIVGPNGSGKSNVVDALAWVMGEQGAKTLRGGKMEDVIFAGTASRGPLGRAEVKLTIDNSDGALPIEYSEVTISRTLFRSGASEYAINGEGCRLLDVQELLSDSGLGREMHVIVGQGQLDAVLRATPEDRRGFIEEAAGILKHRRRKERTLRKLDAMETNLTRLQDLATEIRRQLKPLGRQAEVARAAQSIAAEVRDAKARLLADDVARLRGELAELARSESERHAEHLVLEAQHDQKQQRMAQLEQEQLGDALDDARRVTIALEGAQQKLRGLFTQAQQRLTFLATQAEAPDQSRRVSRSAVDEAAAETARLAQLVPVAESAWRAAQSVSLKAKAGLDAFNEQLNELSALVSQHDLALSQLRGRVDAAGQRQQALEQDLARRSKALEQANERALEAQQALDAYGQDDDSGPALSPEELESEHREAQEALTTAERLRDEARDALHTLETRRSALEARESALAGLLSARDASSELLAAELGGINGRVSDHVRVRPGFEAAVGAALGAHVDALLAGSRDDAVAAIERARTAELGTVRTVVGGEPNPSTAALDAAAIDAAALDAAAVEASATPLTGIIETAPAGVRALLTGSYATADLTQAMVVVRALEAATKTGLNFTVVTSKGDVLTRHTLEGGAGAATTSIETAAELEKARTELETVRAQTHAQSLKLTELRETAQRAKADVHTAYSRMREANSRAAEHAKQRNQLAVRAEVTHAEAERTAQQTEQVKTEAAQAAAAFEDARGQLEEAESTPRPLLDVTARDAQAVELESARAAELEHRLALETARERVRAAQTRERELAIQLEAERVAADEAARREVLRRRQVERAERVASALPAVIEACELSLTEARTEQQRAEADRASRSQELTQLRAEDTALRAKLASLTELAHSAELKSYERRLHLASLIERATNELGLAEEVLLAEYGPDQLIPTVSEEADGPAGEAAAPGEAEGEFASQLEADLARELGIGESGAREAGETRLGSGVPYVREEQERRLAAAEKKLARLGRINPLALEEFAALEQRHRFLSEQLQDLTKTRADLLAIITDLDEKMQGIFGAAFEDTRAAFAEVFPILFPGGAGEISLTDPGDLLTTGIDIAVRPAGKKVERMSLLSGGERSLAAVAWLMAIFQARPSPFYIVDEVEAALDDANLGRLLQVFERLRENSQLIIITHQKRTMEIADALYGVSMRQDGISQVVGQRVNAEQSAI